MDAAVLTLLLGEMPGMGKRRLVEFLNLLGDRRPDINQPNELRSVLASYQNLLRLKEVPTLRDVELSFNKAKRILEAAWQLELKIVAYGEPEFPSRLTQIPNPPALLFLKGDVSCLAAPLICAVIGTRKPTKFGKWTALRLGEVLGKCDIVVVSGLAIGCDTFAHKGSLDGGGQTVAVLAHGLDKIYPAENRLLAERILKNKGCLVSEYAPRIPAFRSQFVERDRLQIGLSDLLVLIESDVRGGSMHTVRFCLEQRKPLGCIAHPPKYLDEAKTKGNQTLIDSGKGMPIKDMDSLARFLQKAIHVSRAKADAIRTVVDETELFPEIAGELEGT